MNDFADPLDTAVITTKYVVRQHFPILFVFHYEDGCWQFSGKEEDLPDEDFMVLGLGEVIELDPSVKHLSHLPLGAMASRKNKQSEWVITPLS
jgi:hypothetical protein